jgi:homeobox-leucine zipper protein
MINNIHRTKLKQTEVDCEYLKKCCETLTEENRRLQKELQELRALKTSQPFYMQLPATTLTMCPSCERVATNTTGAAATKQTASIAAGGRHQ